MGDPKAFLNIPRQEAGYRPVSERITDYSQVEQTLNTTAVNYRHHGVWIAEYLFVTGLVQ